MRVRGECHLLETSHGPISSKTRVLNWQRPSVRFLGLEAGKRAEMGFRFCDKRLCGGLRLTLRLVKVLANAPTLRTGCVLVRPRRAGQWEHTRKQDFRSSASSVTVSFVTLFEPPSPASYTKCSLETFFLGRQPNAFELLQRPQWVPGAWVPGAWPPWLMRTHSNLRSPTPKMSKLHQETMVLRLHRWRWSFGVGADTSQHQAWHMLYSNSPGR